MNAWTDKENAAVVALYFAMLDHATQGTPYNKRAMIRAESNPQGLPNEQHDFPLAQRSKGSIEAKLMNCTAAHKALAPSDETMEHHGYRPLSNMQAALKTAMRDALERRQPYHGTQFASDLA